MTTVRMETDEESHYKNFMGPQIAQLRFLDVELDHAGRVGS